MRQAMARDGVRMSSHYLHDVVVASLTPYIHFPGTAREALAFYGDVFGCTVQMHTLEEFKRTDGPSDAIAHGSLMNGPVSLFGSDATADEVPVHCEGMMLSLLGTAAPSVLREWFTRLSEGPESSMTYRSGRGETSTVG